MSLTFFLGDFDLQLYQFYEKDALIQTNRSVDASALLR